METKKYTVLLVDDEEDVTQIIMKRIDWKGLGFSIIGSASNGVKAMEMVEEFQPDIVMTDIKMPYMDGMELSNRIKTEFPSTKILLFTGFDEFEYAKEAVHLEVEEYILKPVNAAELTRVFTKIKTKLDQEIRSKRNVETLQKYYAESLPLLQTNFYSTLIEGRIPEEDLSKYLSDYQISFSGSFYCCLVVHTSPDHGPEEMNAMLLNASVQKQAEERLVEKWRAKSFFYLGNMVLITQLENENEVSEITDECDRFCKYVRRMIGAVVTVGIGPVCRTVMELPQSYIGAREAISYRGIYGAERAINIHEIAPQQVNDTDESGEAELSKLLKAIRLGSEAEVKEAAGRYLKQIASPAKSIQQYHIHLMDLVSTLYRFAANNDIRVEEFRGDVKQLYNELLEMEPNAMQKWLVGAGLSFREMLIHARSSSTHSYVHKAEEYVRSNYSDAKLSLDDICAKLGVSNSHFSTVFKKETGKSFIAYLTDYRMEQASRMLIGTNEKSYIIAGKVGYTDSNYFSYVFKRRFGVSPSRYRTEHTEREKI